MIEKNYNETHPELKDGDSKGRVRGGNEEG